MIDIHIKTAELSYKHDRYTHIATAELDYKHDKYLTRINHF